jgi:pimeloyl-ACP methyl ester carboxylesterase
MEYSRRDIATLVRVGLVGIASQALAQRTDTLSPFLAAAVHHRRVKANGINLHIAEQGTGPLVLLCHGFPESWYSWRNQFAALANAGFQAVAPDMRGYGQSDAPPEVASYSITDLVGDMVDLVAALGQKQDIIVGHDWGATVAWHAALFRPDVFPAVVALSGPYRQREPAPPLRLLREKGLYTYYWIYYQDVGVAEAEFDRDPRDTLRRRMYISSGDAPRNRPDPYILQPGKGVLDNTINPERLPPWITEADLDYMSADFARTGFRGGLNYYRNIDRNWELLAPWAGAVIRQNALFIAGAEDPSIGSATNKAPLEAMKTTVPNLQRQVLIEGAGHWIQQERPQQVNTALIQFLHGVAVP